jgi:hypothetical protein
VQLKFAMDRLIKIPTRAVVPTEYHRISQQRERGSEKLKNGQERRRWKKWGGFGWEGREWKRAVIWQRGGAKL